MPRLTRLIVLLVLLLVGVALRDLYLLVDEEYFPDHVGAGVSVQESRTERLWVGSVTFSPAQIRFAGRSVHIIEAWIEEVPRTNTWLLPGVGPVSGEKYQLCFVVETDDLRDLTFLPTDSNRCSFVRGSMEEVRKAEHRLVRKMTTEEQAAERAAYLAVPRPGRVRHTIRFIEPPSRLDVRVTIVHQDQFDGISLGTVRAVWEEAHTPIRFILEDRSL